MLNNKCKKNKKRHQQLNNYILRDENAIYYECGYSCDNVIFISLGSDNFFITDGRYEIDAKLNIKNCEVIITHDLVKIAIKILKKYKIKKIYFDPYDFDVATFHKISKNKNIKFIKKPNFSKLKRIIKSDDELKLLKKASKLGRDGFKKFALYLAKYGFDKSDGTNGAKI